MFAITIRYDNIAGVGGKYSRYRVGLMAISKIVPGSQSTTHHPLRKNAKRTQQYPLAPWPPRRVHASLQPLRSPLHLGRSGCRRVSSFGGGGSEAGGSGDSRSGGSRGGGDGRGLRWAVPRRVDRSSLHTGVACRSNSDQKGDKRKGQRERESRDDCGWGVRIVNTPIAACGSFVFTEWSSPNQGVGGKSA